MYQYSCVKVVENFLGDKIAFESATVDKIALVFSLLAIYIWRRKVLEISAL